MPQHVPFLCDVPGSYLLLFLSEEEPEDDFDVEPDDLDSDLEEELLTLATDVPLPDDELCFRDIVAPLLEGAELLEGAFIVFPEPALLLEVASVLLTSVEDGLLLTCARDGMLLTASLRVLVVCVLLTLAGLCIWVLAGAVCSILLLAGTVTGATLSLVPLLMVLPLLPSSWLFLLFPLLPVLRLLSSKFPLLPSILLLLLFPLLALLLLPLLPLLSLPCPLFSP